MRVQHYATHDVITVEPTHSIDAAIALMEEFSVHHLPVVERNRIVGIVSDRDILLSVGWKHSSERHAHGDDAISGSVLGPTTVAEIMHTDVVTLTPDDDVDHAIRTMLVAKIGALPVAKDGKVLGILADSDLLRQVLNEGSDNPLIGEELKGPLSDFLRANVVSVAPTATVFEILDVFHKRHVRHVPVAIDGQLVGIISDRDIRKTLCERTLARQQAIDTHIESPAEPTALEMMTADPITMPPNATLESAIDTMLQNRVHCLPIAQDGDLLGIVTHSDLLRAILKYDAL